MYLIKVVHLTCPDALASDRVVSRDGKPFKPSFAQQCIGSIRNARADYPVHLELDGGGHREENSMLLRQFVAPPVYYFIRLYFNMGLLL